VEEIEHCAVSFDVYDHVCGGYFYRLAVRIWAQWHLTNWVRRVAHYMLCEITDSAGHPVIMTTGDNPEDRGDRRST
jgi:predicted metal-dependent hydrolase